MRSDSREACDVAAPWLHAKHHHCYGNDSAKSPTCTRKPERTSGTMLYTFKVFLIE
jgi:hypothetical protein